MKTLLWIFRRWLLSRLLRREVLALVEAIEAPQRWLPDQPFTKAELAEWETALQRPLMVKIDHAMINLVQQEAQRALLSPAGELPRQAGYALGVRAGWEMAKSLSRLPVAHDGQSEETATTAAGDLEHLQP